MTVANMETKMGIMETKMGVVNEDIKEIKSDIKEIKLALESNFVTRMEFNNYKSTQNTQKILLSIINLIFGALLGFFISQVATQLLKQSK